jgi:hypothetical protein
VALTFHVEKSTAGATKFTVAVQVVDPATETFRLYQLLPDEPADSVAVQPLEPTPPPPAAAELAETLELPPPPKDSVARIW